MCYPGHICIFGFQGSTVMSTVIKACNKSGWARASPVSWLQFYVVPPGYCKVIGSWNTLRPITRAFPRSIPINHPPCSIKGKVPMFGARNTNLCGVSMCKDSCSLERCAGACFLLGNSSRIEVLLPALSLLMWQQIWGQKALTGSPLGAKAARKKIFRAKQNPIIWMNLCWGKAENTELDQQTQRNLFILENSILNNNGEKAYSALSTGYSFSRNKQTLQRCLTSSEVPAESRIDGNSEKSQGAHKVQVTAVPSSAAAATGSLFLKSFFSEEFCIVSWLETDSEIHLNCN